jgi:hypothetical protein
MGGVTPHVILAVLNCFSPSDFDVASPLQFQLQARCRGGDEPQNAQFRRLEPFAYRQLRNLFARAGCAVWGGAECSTSRYWNLLAGHGAGKLALDLDSRAFAHSITE